MESLTALNLGHLDQRAQLGFLHDAGAPAPRDSAEAKRTTADSAPEREFAGRLSYSRSERTTLFIKTQEGDVVKLKFQAGESVDASASQSKDDGELVSELHVQARSSSRIAIRIKGELSADELSAIQAVVEQAGELASEFFSGDLAGAFAAASDLNVDGQQLAKVALKLKVREKLTYAESGLPFALAPAAPVAPASIEPAVTAIAFPGPSATAGSAPTDSDPVAVSGSASPVIAENTAPAPDAEMPPSAAEEPGPVPPVAAAPIDFLELISDFLAKLLEAFGEGAAAGRPGEQTTSIDLSLKLKIFSSVLLSAGAVAGENESGSNSEIETATDPVPALVEETVEALAANEQPPLELIA